MASETPKKEPTPAEAMFFFSILKNMKNKADIDWHAVAADQKFKNAEVAKVRFGQIKRKHGFSGDAPSTPKSAGPPPTKVTKSTGRSGGKKGKAAAAAASSTPSRVKTEDAGERMRAMQDDDEGVPPSKNFIVKRELMEEDEKKFGGAEGLMSDADPF